LMGASRGFLTHGGKVTAEQSALVGAGEISTLSPWSADQVVRSGMHAVGGT
jgi:hypothetical protein